MDSELAKSIHGTIEDEFSCFICLELTIDKQLGKTTCCKQYICKYCFNQQKNRENKCGHCRNSENYSFKDFQSLNSSLHTIENKILEQVKSDSMLNSIIQNHEMEMVKANTQIEEMKQLVNHLMKKIEYLGDDKNVNSATIHY